MRLNRKYFTLIASLPALPHFASAERPPINRERLDQRLKMLEEDDRKVVDQAEGFIAWQRQPATRTDAEVVEYFARLESLNLPGSLRRTMRFRMDMRTIFAAMRRRARGNGRPPQPWGAGAWVRTIERHWDHPDFQLQAVYPWLPEARQLLESGQSLQLEKMLMEEVWKQLNEISETHAFGLEEILAYLFKWDIVQRWTLNNEEAARSRIQALAEDALGSYAELFSSTNQN